MGPEREALCFRAVRPCVRVCICTYVALAHARPGEGTLRPACCRLPVHNISRGFQCASCQRSKGVNGVIGVASYGALEHVPPPIDFQQFILFCFCFGAIQSTTAISYVKYLQDLRAAVIKISSFFILLKKWKVHIGYFCITVCVSCV